MRIQPHRAFQHRIEIRAIKQALQTGHVIHMGVRDVNRTRRGVVYFQITGQRFRPAIDQQQRRAIALEYGAGRAELDRLGRSDAEKTQGQVHRRLPVEWDNAASPQRRSYAAINGCQKPAIEIAFAIACGAEFQQRTPQPRKVRQLPQSRAAGAVRRDRNRSARRCSRRAGYCAHSNRHEIRRAAWNSAIVAPTRAAMPASSASARRRSARVCALTIKRVIRSAR